MKIKIKRFDHGWDVPLPARQHYNDAGADVYTAEGVTLKPHETRRIPLGFGIELPDCYMAAIFPRSSKACDGIVCQLAPIDPGYRGEVYAIVTNTTDRLQLIEGKTRVGQLVVLQIAIPDFVEELGEERGDGAFGSTEEA